MDNKEQIEKNSNWIEPTTLKLRGLNSYDPENNYGAMTVIAGGRELFAKSPTLQMMALEAYKVVWHSPNDRVKISFNEQTNEIYMIEIFSKLVA